MAFKKKSIGSNLALAKSKCSKIMLTPKSYKGHAADQRPDMHTHTAALSSHLLGVHICRPLRSALRAAFPMILGLGYPEPTFSFVCKEYTPNSQHVPPGERSREQPSLWIR